MDVWIAHYEGLDGHRILGVFLTLKLAQDFVAGEIADCGLMPETWQGRHGEWLFNAAAYKIRTGTLAAHP